MTNRLENAHCRLCADFKSYDQLIDLEAEKEKRLQVLEKLFRLNLQVTDLHSSEDILPKTVCVLCMDSLFKAYNFILDVEIAQEILKANILVQDIKQQVKNQENTKQMYIKQEDTKQEDVKVQIDNTLTICSTEKEAETLNNPLPNAENVQKSKIQPELWPKIKIEVEESNENDFQNDLEHDSNDSDLDTTDIKDFEIDSEESSREIELKRTLENNLYSNDFKKDFEVTVNGYQMEISSKLVLNNNDNISNEREVTIGNDINTKKLHSNSNLNNYGDISSPQIDKNTNIHSQTRKRKHSNCNDSNDSRTEQVKIINENSLKNSVLSLEENVSSILKINRTIVALDKISIHNGSNNTLIISPSESILREGKDLKVGLKRPKETDFFSDEIELSVNEKNTQLENEDDTVPDESSLSCMSQLESSWEQYIWKCYDCKEVFDSVNRLITHTKEIHMCCGNYECTNCIFFTSDLDIFVDHMSIHKEYLSRICFKCNKGFTSTKLTRAHYASCSKSDHQCSGCHETFKTEEELLKHKEIYVMQHNMIQTEEYNCPKQSPKAAKEEVQKKKPVEQEQISELKICDLCGMVFMYKHFLIYHLQNHHKFCV